MNGNSPAALTAPVETAVENSSRRAASALQTLYRRFMDAPVESLSMTILGPWLMSTLGRGVWKLLTEATHENPKYTVLRKTSANESEQTTEAGLVGGGTTIKYRGKSFNQTNSKEKVDLSWLGALPYWVPVSLLGLEGFLMFRHGTEYFKQRGYTPAQRHLVQAYIFFAVLPLVDLLSGDDWANPTKEQQKNRRLAYRFRLPLYMWTVFEYVITIATFRLVLDFSNGLSKRSRFALIMQMGLFNGVFGINVSHELLHKNNRFEKALAWALLTNVNYCHWSDEHEIGHHANVATPLDPASSRQGETLFQFLPRTFVGSFRSACNLEAERLRKLGITQWYTPQNRVLRGLAGSALWAATLAKISKSMWAIPMFYAQALFGAHLLEVVNYIEHFGLERKFDPATGQYEPVDPRHSWNAPNKFSNTILFKLQRHSDHHTFPTRPYEILRNFVESPNMPTGYIGMFVLAFIPKMYFLIMNPLLEAHRIESNPDKEPTEEELARVQELKNLARWRIWAWTFSTFSVSTAVLIVSTWRMNQNAKQTLK